MAIRFKFKNQKIITDATFFMFDEFVNVWRWDKGKLKPKANAMLYFIYLLCDLGEENPIREEPAEAKEAKAMKYAYGSKKSSFTKKELELLEPALECYVKYNNTAEERILTTFDDKANELRDELEGTEPETEEYTSYQGVQFVSNSGIITKGLADLDTIKRYKASVIASIKREAVSNKVRGQLVLSPLSKGIISLPSFAEAQEETTEDV